MLFFFSVALCRINFKTFKNQRFQSFVISQKQVFYIPEMWHHSSSTLCIATNPPPHSALGRPCHTDAHCRPQARRRRPGRPERRQEAGPPRTARGVRRRRWAGRSGCGGRRRRRGVAGRRHPGECGPGPHEGVGGQWVGGWGANLLVGEPIFAIPPNTTQPRPEEAHGRAGFFQGR